LTVPKVDKIISISANNISMGDTFEEKLSVIYDRNYLLFKKNVKPNCKVITALQNYIRRVCNEDDEIFSIAISHFLVFIKEPTKLDCIYTAFIRNLKKETGIKSRAKLDDMYFRPLFS